MGMVARLGPDGQKPVGKGAWESNMLAEGLVGQAPAASLGLTTYWDDSTRTVGARADLAWITAPPGTDYRVQFYLVESHIIDWQLDNGVDIENYEHNHVLRAGMNGEWGTDVTALAQGDTEQFVSDIVADANWVRENCEIVAFVYDADSYEVLQAVHAHLP